MSEEYIFYGKPPSREIASLRSQRQYIRLVDSSVGYFAALNMTYLVWGIAAALRATSPEGGSKTTRHCEEVKRRSNLPGGWRSTEYILRTFSVRYFAYAQYDVLGLGDCRGTLCLAMTTSRAMIRWDISLRSI